GDDQAQSHGSLRRRRPRRHNQYAKRAHVRRGSLVSDIRYCGTAPRTAKAGSLQPAPRHRRSSAPRSSTVERFYHVVGLAYFTASTIALMLLGVMLLGMAVWDVVAALGSQNRLEVALNSVGLLIIGFAVIETAQFIAEEELVRKRELRSAT